MLRTLSFVLALALSSPLLAQTAPKTKSLGAESPKTALYVGNSFFYFNDSMHSIVGRLLAAADPQGRYRATSITISGSGLNWHDMEAYFQPGRLASYSFTADNKVVFNKFDKPFDVVIMALMRATGCTSREAEIEAWEAHTFGKAPVHFASKSECEQAAAIIGSIGVETEVAPEWKD